MPSLPLSYVPIKASLHVYLNGVEQYEEIDWVYDPGVNVIRALAAMDARFDDLLEARYAHLLDSVDVVGGDFIDFDATTGLGSTSSIQWPAHNAGDLLLWAVTLNGTLATPAGYHLAGDIHNDANWPESLYVFYKEADGTEGDTHATKSGGGWYAGVGLVYRNLTFKSASFNKAGDPTIEHLLPDSDGEGRIVYIAGKDAGGSITINPGTLRDEAGLTQVQTAMYDYIGQGAAWAVPSSPTDAAKWLGATVTLADA